jgi:hypothetical protein
MGLDDPIQYRISEPKPRPIPYRFRDPEPYPDRPIRTPNSWSFFTTPYATFAGPNPDAIGDLMARASNHLAKTDQRVRDFLAKDPELPVTAARVRAAHESVFGTMDGAAACVVRFDRAGLLRTATGELGARGARAAARAAGQPVPEATHREPRAPKAGAAAILAEYKRLRELPEHKFTSRGELAVMADENVEKAAKEKYAAAHPPKAPKERVARAPLDPLRKTDQRVREFVRTAEITPQAPTDRAGLRLIHSEVFGDRPADEGEPQAAWDKELANCVVRFQKAGLIPKRARTAAPPSGVRLTPDEKKAKDANVKLMREAKGEVSCLKKHALSMYKIDADVCPVGKSKAAGDAARASKNAALKQIEGLWTSAMQAETPVDAVRLLGEASDVVRQSFPGIRLGFEGQAAKVYTDATGIAA